MLCVYTNLAFKISVFELFYEPLFCLRERGLRLHIVGTSAMISLRCIIVRLQIELISSSLPCRVIFSKVTDPLYQFVASLVHTSNYYYAQFKYYLILSSVISRSNKQEYTKYNIMITKHHIPCKYKCNKVCILHMLHQSSKSHQASMQG